MIQLDRIYNMDCLAGMKDIPDQSVDAIICDLPYGTTRNSWDSVIPMDKLWNEYRRVAKESAAIVLFGQQPFTSMLVASNPAMFRYEWIWRKEQGTGFLNANKAPLKVHENILVFYRTQPTYNPQFTQGDPYATRRAGHNHSSNYGKQADVTTISDGRRFPVDVIDFQREKDGTSFHPTQKPVDLVRYLVRTYTDKGGGNFGQLYGQRHNSRRVHQGGSALLRLRAERGILRTGLPTDQSRAGANDII